MIDARETGRLMRILGGSPTTEGAVLEFILARYGAGRLDELSPKVAREILRRPGDFLRTVRKWKQPELNV